MKPKIFIHLKQESERVPQKNFRLLPNGVPLWEHTVRKFAPHFDMLLDTDSDEILWGCAGISGVKAYQRDSSLVGNHVSAVPLVSSIIKRCKLTGPIIQINVTTPFLRPQTVLDALKRLGENGTDSVASVDVLHARIWKEDYEIQQGGRRWVDEHHRYSEVNHFRGNLLRTQDLDPVFVENSAYYVFDCQQFMKTGSRVGHRPLFIQTLFPEGIDIDTEEDWKRTVAFFPRATESKDQDYAQH